jgi:outer membrane protein
MKNLLFASAILLTASSAAYAQGSTDVRIRVGLGGQLRPKFIGSDDTELAPLWRIDIARGTNQFRFKAPDDSLAIAVVSKDGFSFGPAANLEPGRKNSDVGVPLGKVKMTIEAGAFAQYQAGDSIRVRGEVRKGIGGHNGVVGALGVDKIWRNGDQYVFSIGPRVLFSDSRYQRAFFEVTPAASLATGLPAYRPGGGIHAVALESGLSYQLNNRFGLFGFARYERLVGDAAKSPIVRELGSRNQLSGGLGLNYTFNIKL